MKYDDNNIQHPENNNSSPENERDVFSITSPGGACSVFTVNYCLLNYNEKQFVVFYDEQRRITIGTHTTGEDNWQLFQPGGFWIPQRKRYSSVTDYDSHNYLTMAIDCEGFLHVSGNMHVDPLIYYRSEKPLDIFSLCCVKEMTGQKEDRVTYPLFFKDGQGNLLFRYRDGMSGNGDDIYNSWDPHTRSWTRLIDTPLLDGEGVRNGYARLPVAGPDGFWHMIWMWRETPHCETNNTLSYARSRDLRHWENSAGDTITLPINIDRGEVVDPAPVKGGLINMSQELGFDSVGRPVITWHRYDQHGQSQAWIARPNGTGCWQINCLSQWNFRWDFQGPGSIPPDVVISAARAGAQGTLEVEYHSQWTPSGIWIIDETTLTVTGQREYHPALPDCFYHPQQDIHPDATVQLIPALNSDNTLSEQDFLRWESLPIFRDVFYGAEVKPARLEIIHKK